MAFMQKGNAVKVTHEDSIHVGKVGCIIKSPPSDPGFVGVDFGNGTIYRFKMSSLFDMTLNVLGD